MDSRARGQVGAARTALVVHHSSTNEGSTEHINGAICGIYPSENGLRWIARAESTKQSLFKKQEEKGKEKNESRWGNQVDQTGWLESKNQERRV